MTPLCISSILSSVMEKIVEQGKLFDYYGNLLTEHQQSIYSDAVFENMSLTELAEGYDISRQAAHDLLKRCDAKLKEYENKLHLVEKFERVQKISADIKEKSHKLQIDEATDKELVADIIKDAESIDSILWE